MPNASHLLLNAGLAEASWWLNQWHYCRRAECHGDPSTDSEALFELGFNNLENCLKFNRHLSPNFEVKKKYFQIIFDVVPCFNFYFLCSLVFCFFFTVFYVFFFLVLLMCVPNCFSVPAIVLYTVGSGVHLSEGKCLIISTTTQLKMYSFNPCFPFPLFCPFPNPVLSSVSSCVLNVCLFFYSSMYTFSILCVCVLSCRTVLHVLQFPYVFAASLVSYLEFIRLIIPCFFLQTVPLYSILFSLLNTSKRFFAFMQCQCQSIYIGYGIHRIS